MESTTSRLTKEIDQYLDTTLQNNKLFVGARHGAVTPDIVSRYLTNITHIVSHTEGHLARAAEVARTRGFDRLATWFLEKIEEETGHDQWGVEDHAELVERFTIQSSPQLLATTRALVGYIRETIDYDPRLYLSYILLAETGAVRVGPVFIQDLEDHCEIPPTVMRVLGNHAELDKEHIEDDLQEIDELLSNSGLVNQDEFFSALRRSMVLFEELHTEIFQLH